MIYADCTCSFKQAWTSTPRAWLQSRPSPWPLWNNIFAPRLAQCRCWSREWSITMSFRNPFADSLALPTISENHIRSTSPTPRALGGGIIIFSGGSAANSLVEVFNEVRDANHTTLSYVIPISDNGGSSSEIIRVFGGPGMWQPQ
jgi:hypothetical protein